MDQNVLLLIALGAGAYFLLKKSGGPVFRNMQGQAISSIACGNSITFDVPGQSHVWMSQLKDGQLHFDGPFAVPMPPYVLNCTSDRGVYEVAVYGLNADGTKGSLLGQTRFTVS